jgi:phage-related protein
MSRKIIFYYVDIKGRSPVAEALAGLGMTDRQKTAAYISLLEEHGEGLRRPTADYIGDKLYELRPRKVRVLYFFLSKDVAVITHIFLKRTGRISDADKMLAAARMQQFVDRYRGGFITLGDDYEKDQGSSSF